MGGTANPGWSKAKYAARGVHLDQDTAGRLLESMGDHARREMIVRTTQVIRQNPAYRPIARNATTSDGISSEVVCFSSTTVWQEKSAYTTRKNDLALRCLSADRLCWRSHFDAGIPYTGSAATASDRLPVRQLMGVQLRPWGNALPGFANRRHREPI